MTRLLRRGASARLVAVTAGLFALMAVAAPAASAHPLGNFTVNYYEGLHLTPHRVDVLAVTDAAELPTYQTVSPAVDRNSDAQYSPAEKQAYVDQRCGVLAAGLQLTVDGRRIPLRAAGGTLEFLPSTALRGLFTSRLTCNLAADADLTRSATLTFGDHVDARYGWHEITATGTGVHVTNSAVAGSGGPVAGTSISDELRHYPNNLLSSPLAVRDVRLTVAPGSGPAASGKYDVSSANFLVKALEPLTSAFQHTAGTSRLTLPVGLLALALAILLGGGHAALPGHGKTVMAAYLIGRRGSLRDAVLVGTTVTLTHTAGVLVLGLAITLGTAFVGTQTLSYLGVVSGLLVAAVGVGLLRSALRNRRALAASVERVETVLAAPEPALVAATGRPATAALAEAADHDHGHEPGRGHDHGPHGHGHDHDHGHGPHGHGHDHGHSHGPLFSARGLVGIGVAGGLVPSPSALAVLLSAVALGRTLFGILLVLGYGFGMAATLMCAGFLLVRLGSRLDRFGVARRLRSTERYVRALPIVTAVLVLVVGLGLAVRALSTA